MKVEKVVSRFFGARGYTCLMSPMTRFKFLRYPMWLLFLIRRWFAIPKNLRVLIPLCHEAIRNHATDEELREVCWGGDRKDGLMPVDRALAWLRNSRNQKYLESLSNMRVDMTYGQFFFLLFPLRVKGED